MASKGYFQTNQHAVNYKKYRCEMSEELVQRILNFLGKQFQLSECVAVDVGCGSGQSIFPLAPHLLKIVGVDTSMAQLSEITADPRGKNVELREGKAESLPISDNSVHLVIAMHAVHWFDYSAFIKEVDRVLVPGGVLAFGDGEGGYNVLGHEKEAKKLYEELQHSVATNWNYKIQNKDIFYQTVKPPYEESIREQMPIEFSVNVDFFIGRLKTLSAFGKYLDEHPKECEELFQKFQKELMKILGATASPEETNFTYTKQYFLILSRKPMKK